MKKRFWILFIIFTILSTYVYGWSFSIIGRAHVFAHKDLKSIFETKSEVKKWSTLDLAKLFTQIYNHYSSNDLMRDQKLKEQEHMLIIIHGTVERVRKSFFDEYVVELTIPGYVDTVGVVFPANISQAMINELMTYERGDYFESFALTRTTSAFVDVPVWDAGGVYRTEP